MHRKGIHKRYKSVKGATHQPTLYIVVETKYSTIDSAGLREGKK